MAGGSPTKRTTRDGLKSTSGRFSTSGHWLVSTDGGTRPLWARTGQELFYLTPTDALMRVGVARGPAWAATGPTKLFERHYGAPSFNFGRTYGRVARRPALPDDQGRRRWRCQRDAGQHGCRSQLAGGTETACADGRKAKAPKHRIWPN
jgi:hypothetical protein